MPRGKVSVKKPSVVKREQIVKPLRFHRKKTAVEKVADVLTGFFGTLAFLLLNLMFFVVWIIWNLDLHPAMSPFDPYPFGMLTMIVSLEAIILSIVVLISQNRANKVADAREEIDFEVDVASEQQITEILKTLDSIAKHLKINHTVDRDTMQSVDIEKLQRRVIFEEDTD